MPFSKVTGLPLANVQAERNPVDYELIKSKYKSGNIDLDDHLLSSLDMGKYRFSVTDQEFYSVLSVVGPGDGLLLLNKGIRSAEETTAYLTEIDMRNLFRPNSHLTEAALDSNMNPLVFIEFLESTTASQRHQKEAADAVRAFALEKEVKPGVSFFSSIGKMVIDGDMRYEDVKLIGAAMVHRHSDMAPLHSRLYDLATHGDLCDFDASHVLAALQRRIDEKMDPTNTNAVLLLMGITDGDFAVARRNPDKLLRFVPINEAPDKDYLVYADSVFTAAEGASPERGDIEVLFQHSIPVEMAAKGLKEGRSGQQIVAMSEGVEPSLTGGWL